MIFLKKKPEIIAILGPTCAGKTHLAHQLSDQLNAQLINCDRSLFYKELNIGTCKPITPYLNKYHLMNFLDDIRDSYSVYHFIEKVSPLIQFHKNHGRKVIIVGGSMLYNKFLLEGFLPYNVSKLTEAQKYILSIAPNIYTIQVTRDREKLYQKIEERLDQTFQAGFLREVSCLIEKYNYSVVVEIKSIGYKQCAEYLKGLINYQRLFELVLFSTRQLAKKQYTWLRSWNRINEIIIAE
jgi:tRNA dimethylallyltransferase